MAGLSSLLIAISLTVPPAAPVVATAEVRQAVQRSIPYIEDRGVWWIEKKECVSCHRVGNMLWSLSAAKQRGFTVSDRLDEWTTWAIDSSLEKNDKGNIVGSGNLEGLSQMLLAASGDQSDPLNGEHRSSFLKLIREGQKADGTWKPGGQLPGQKRPQAETTDVSTMWLALALAQAGGDEGNSPALKKALQRIDRSEVGSSTEWIVVRLLLAHHLGQREQVETFIEALRSRQRGDGGWGWLSDDESDALATGMAVYALVRAGVRRTDSAVQQAQRFLVTTQRGDGSWAVKGTKAKRQKAIQETATYWGTAWAALGLIESLPE